MQTLTHITLNTGHTIVARKPLPEAIEAMRPIIDSGAGPVPGWPEWQIKISWPFQRAGGCMFMSVESASGDAILMGYVGWSADSASQAWDEAMRAYNITMGAYAGLDLKRPTPARPAPPWMVVWLLPIVGANGELGMPPRDLLRDVGALERGLAFAAMGVAPSSPAAAPDNITVVIGQAAQRTWLRSEMLGIVIDHAKSYTARGGLHRGVFGTNLDLIITMRDAALLTFRLGGVDVAEAAVTDGGSSDWWHEMGQRAAPPAGPWAVILPLAQPAGAPSDLVQIVVAAVKALAWSYVLRDRPRG